MSFLHKKHIVHRDLKPSNILLDDDFQPHIIDFGLSKFLEKGKPTSSIQPVGTRIYMSPETIKNSIYNEKTDVYSFGILMYEVVTNKIPYSNINGMTEYAFNFEVIEKNERPIFDESIKESIKNLIQLCWSKNPDERPTFEELFNKLAFNDENWIIDVYEGNESENEYDINKYFLDGVDTEEVLSYAESIQDASPIDEIKEENEKLKIQLKRLQEKNQAHTKLFDKLESQNKIQAKQIKKLKEENEIQNKQILSIEKVTTFSGFNALQFISQMELITNIINNIENDQITECLKNVFNILKYLKSLKADENGHYIELLNADNNEIMVNGEKLEKIRLLKDATNILFQEGSSRFDYFINLYIIIL
ncbi:hypothetical protein M9Y10_019555 [Tritrichomonas musculus]|uniref:Protein kinase domain-containing protein n=1 Tax=Tritrichomonas musculus TaxID=1915356 RepID=A0ABR2HHK3_9EUKA